MPAALFGITDDTLNLVVNLLVLFLFVVWFALIAWTYFDAKRRIDDPVLVMCATGAALFPYVGTIVYSILRPPELLADKRERELEIRASELRVRQLEEQSCPNCQQPIERTYLRCPRCRARIKHPCEACRQPVDPRWSLCPYCETALPSAQAERRPAPAPARRRETARPKRSAERASRQQTKSREPAARKAPSSGDGQGRAQDRPKRSTSRSAPASKQRQASPGSEDPGRPQPQRSGDDDESARGPRGESSGRRR
jgi:hypothetical protein